MKQDTPQPLNEMSTEPVLQPEVAVTEVTNELAVHLRALKQQFHKRYIRFRYVGYVVIAIVLAIVIVAYTVVFPLQPNGAMAGIIMIILALTGSMVFNKINRNKLTRVIRQYMVDYHDQVNQLALKEENITNYVFDFEGKMTADEFAKAHIAKDVVKTNSRNLLTYELGDKNVQMTDYIAYRNFNKRLEPVFVGKLIIATRKKKVDDRVVIYVKPNPLAFPDSGGPDDIEDLTLVLDNSFVKIFAKDDGYKKTVPAKALKICEQIETNKILPDVTISIYEDKVVIAATYGDEMMVVPYKEDVPVASIEQFKNNLATFHDLINAL